MRKNYIITVLACLSLLLVGGIESITAQTWQWAQRGGGMMATNRPETTHSICNDSFGNVYLTSTVGPTNLNIAGVTKQTYNNEGSTDGVIASFSCEGTYRWSKVIGGSGLDDVKSVRSDAFGNIYATGFVEPVSPTQTPIHFDADTILPSAYPNQNLYNKSMFLVKYNSGGNLEWLRMPQPDDVNFSTSFSQTGALDLQVDAQGNLYWLCHLPPGIYANGALNVPVTGNYILKYDTDGNYIESTLLDLQVDIDACSFKMKINQSTGDIYIYDRNYIGSGSGPTIIAGGQNITHSIYLIAFGSNGNFLWKAENQSINTLGLNDDGGFGIDLAIDSDNNIYFTSTAGKITNSSSPPDSFNGVSLIQPTASNALPWAFVAKINQQGSTIWQTNGNYSTAAAIVLDGDMIVMGGHTGYTMQWQNLTHTAVNQGYHPAIFRFNKTNGDIIDINAIESTGVGDFVTSIAKDLNGSYYIGGKFESTMTVGSSNLSINGSQSDFFIAKFCSSNCTLASESFEKGKASVWPNPVKGMLHVDGMKGSYGVYDVRGMLIKTGTVGAESEVDFDGIAAGVYLLKAGGDVVKVVKE